jgi:cobalt-zinc-cadmium efflux system outer membrane protein
LARARAETVRAQRQLELERRLRWPNLALKAAVDEDPDMRTSQFGVVVTVPLVGPPQRTGWRGCGPIVAGAQK